MNVLSMSLSNVLFPRMIMPQSYIITSNMCANLCKEKLCYILGLTNILAGKKYSTISDVLPFSCSFRKWFQSTNFIFND